MAEVQRFRSAFNGFNREDVVNYIEQLNTQHKTEIEQLNAQLKTAQEKASAAEDFGLRIRLDTMMSRCTQLEEELSKAKAELALAQEELDMLRECALEEAEKAEIPTAAPVVAPVAAPAPSNFNMEELEAYRRAERVEREAKERAHKIQSKANEVLADVTAKAEAASAQVSGLVEQMSSQMEIYQRSILDTKDAFQDAVAALSAMESIEEI